jgi:hypothetical protein
MSRKFIVEAKSKALYEFTVTMVKRSNQQYKVTKSYPEFVELESYVIDIINHYTTKKASHKKFPLLSKT